MVAAISGLLVTGLMVSGGLSSLPAGTTSHPLPKEALGPGQLPGGIQFSRDRGPLLFGESISIEEAESRAGVHLPRPTSKFANDKTIRNVFYEKRSFDEELASYIVAIDYDSGVIVLIHPASYDGITDPWTTYDQAADSLNASIEGSIASVDTIKGVPALAIQRSANGVSSVDLVLTSGLRVQVIAKYAPDVDVSTIEAIAESLK